MKTPTPQQIHDRDVVRIMKAIIAPTMAAGGEFTDVLVLLESVVVGVILFGIKEGGDDPVLAAMVERIKLRLEEARLKDKKPENA